MNLITIDNCGLACPQPVINTKKALDSLSAGQSLISIVDNAAAKENVTRFAINNGCTVNVEEKNGIYSLTLTKSKSMPAAAAPPAEIPSTGGKVIFVRSNRLGTGSDELGSLLIKSFFYAVSQTADYLPAKIVLINSGVKLAVTDSPVLQDLQALAAAGVEVLACGTCLDFYGLKDQLAVGQISNMYSIYEVLAGHAVLTL
ncbi:MAG: sulfurtransferase-like selenium metabolism protein YedF [Negativicutes bacterium]|nr:sulfurtransferase-like selenium metabolism protein YedF [Negativicutes bacterium]